MYLSGQPSPEEVWARVAAAERRMRDSGRTLPAYGVAEWSGRRMAGDWAWHGDTLVTIGLAHGDPVGDGPLLHVLTTSLDVDESVVSLRMGAVGAPADRDGYVRRRREIAQSPSDLVRIAVDTAPVDFRLWRGLDRWWIAAENADYGLIVEGRNAEPQGFALARVHDLEPYIAGRRAYLRTRLGED